MPPTTLDPANYPLRFAPILKEKIWGGRRLETVLGRMLPRPTNYGESWEIADHHADSTSVINGPWRGHTLGELTRLERHELLGAARGVSTAEFPGAATQFPLLVKWIDARERLSVQVHPETGHPRLPPGESGKSECWYVLDAEPGANLFIGLKRGIDRQAFERELVRGTADRCLNSFDAHPGDFFFVPAGTVHAIGAGVLLAEIQQASDTTFRLFDWNRIDPTTGRPRELHIAAALESIKFDAAIAPSLVRAAPDQFETVLLGRESCPNFVVVRRRLRDAAPIGLPGRLHILVCVGGSGEVLGAGETAAVRRGDCLLLPAAGQFTCRPQGELELLDTWMPQCEAVA